MKPQFILLSFVIYIFFFLNILKEQSKIHTKLESLSQFLKKWYKTNTLPSKSTQLPGINMDSTSLLYQDWTKSKLLALDTSGSQV